jgi:hypothetical protein
MYVKQEEHNLDVLVGKKILHVMLSEDKTYLAFFADDAGLFGWTTEGDCCSTSWIEHINGVQALLGEVVTGVVSRDLPDPPENKDDYDVIQRYGWTLETKKGRCDIEMRNHSNGYYGGWLQWQKPRTPVDHHSLLDTPLPNTQFVTVDI